MSSPVLSSPLGRLTRRVFAHLTSSSENAANGSRFEHGQCQGKKFDALAASVRIVPPSPCVLSLYPNVRGLGYVLFEKPLSPYDWGVTEARGADRNRVFLRRLKKLLVVYRPAVVVLEDWTDRERPRSKRITALYRQIVKLSLSMDIPVEMVSLQTVRRVFAAEGAKTKHEIAQMIVKHIPALASYRIPKRKIWQPENPREALYEAAALGLTFFQRSIRRTSGTPPHATP